MKLPAAGLPRLALAVAALLGLLAAWQTYALVRGERDRQRQAQEQGRQEARRMADTIDALLRTLEPEVRALAADLSAGRVPDDQLQDRLEAGLKKTPAAFRMGVNYAPFVKDPGKALVAPYVVREGGGMRRYQMGDTVNYATQNWFQEDMGGEGWQEPHVSRLSHQVVAGFSMFIRKPGDPQSPPLGFVRMDLSLNGIRQILDDAGQNLSGYLALLAPKGTFLAHPRRDWVAEERTIFQVARETSDAKLWRCGELAARGEPGVVDAVSYLGDQPIWIFSQPIPSAHWTLQAAVFRGEGLWDPVARRRTLMALAGTLMGLIAALGAGLMDLHPGSLKHLGHWQGLVATLLGLGVCLLWLLTLVYPDPFADRSVPLLTQEHLTKYLAAHSHNSLAQSARTSYRIPTGLLLDTLRFDANNDAVATGFIWQRYPADFPKDRGQGFLVANAESQEAFEVARRHEARGDLVQYRFKAVLPGSQPDITKYPFDKSLVRLLLGPRELDGSVALVPDLNAYRVLSPTSLPGLDGALELPGWTKLRSSFGFQETTYSTSFGAWDENTADQAPKVAFQLVLSRQITNPFIFSMLPVVVAACLLYILLIVGFRPRDSSWASGMRADRIVPVAASLVFPVIVAHINLRSRISSSSVLYLEYFYFVIYAAILHVAGNAPGMSDEDLQNGAAWIRARLLYWPLVMGAFFLISLIFLY